MPTLFQQSYKLIHYLYKNLKLMYFSSSIVTCKCPPNSSHVLIQGFSQHEGWVISSNSSVSQSVTASLRSCRVTFEQSDVSADHLTSTVCFCILTTNSTPCYVLHFCDVQKWPTNTKISIQLQLSQRQSQPCTSRWRRLCTLHPW